MASLGGYRVSGSREQQLWETLRVVQNLKWVDLFRGKQVQFILERVVHKLFFTALFALFASGMTRWLSQNQVLSFIFWFGVVLLLYYIMQQYEMRPVGERRTRRIKSVAQFLDKKAKSNCSKKAWRQLVGSELVCVAWEALVGSIIQEWVYDTWYGILTPDREFPAQIRQLLNDLFGQVCERVKRVDIKELLISDLLQLASSQLSLFRDVRATIGENRLQAMKPQARERAMRQELLTEGNLHHALETRDSQYRYLSALSDALVCYIISQDDWSSEIVHSIARELLASCVFRPLMWIFTPYSLNKFFLQAFASPEIARQLLQYQSVQDKSEEQHGVFVFEERFRKSHKQEERSLNGEKPSIASSSHEKKAKKEAAAVSQLHKVKSVDSSMTTEQLVPGLRSHTLGAVSTGSVPHQQSSNTSNSDVEEMSSVRREEQPEEPARIQHSIASGSLPSMDIGAKNAFVGRPRAKVATSEIRYGRNSKRKTSFVAFGIRVGDDQGEWSVTRRFRNFEDLDSALRRCSPKKLAQRYEEFTKTYKLPRKLVFAPHFSDAKVEQRRQGLNTYIEALIKDPELSTAPEVWEFFNPNSTMYLLDIDVGFLRSIGFNINKAGQSAASAAGNGMRRALSRGPSRPMTPREEELDVTGRRHETVDIDMRPLTDILHPQQESILYPTPTPTPPPPIHPHPNEDLSLQFLWQKSQEMAANSANNSTANISNESETPQRMVRHRHRRSFSQGSTVPDVPTVPELDSNILFSSLDRQSRKVKLAEADENSVVDGSEYSDNIDDTEDTLLVVQSFVWFIDTLFQLHARGIRKTFNSIMMQFFQIVAADGVDAWVMSWISNLRSEHFVARSINQLRLQLWPGGTWFQYLPPVADPEKPYFFPPSRPEHVTMENFMSTHVNQQEANQLALQVKQVLFSKVPERLVAVVGRQPVTSGLKDLYQLMQSDVFMSQIGYIALDRLIGELFPELEQFLDDMPNKLRKSTRR